MMGSGDMHTQMPEVTMDPRWQVSEGAQVPERAVAWILSSGDKAPVVDAQCATPDVLPGPRLMAVFKECKDQLLSALLITVPKC